ncbi:alpha/beta hydrolase fold domain-containing protein [Paenibacillus endoradicis]|uniref:alpha/beta hydrolase fold domain-containing protein n=1 Tax=Paenibacillus endoradicis TaxID=2972487 RepID=UPI002158E594|nr:alpha/beta hydrolase fold domain-containing protein [Paenibacillus endoradicis]MCR8656145.1 alpha/beta hydrolase fold domain-containing protein [Paenibacillus endoradicis]
MKRWVISVFAILLIVIGCWMLMNALGNESNSENQEKAVVTEDTVTTNAAIINVTVNNGRDLVQYLTPAYEVTVTKDILYANKKNETDVEELLKFDLYQPVEDNNEQRPIFIYVHGGGYTGGNKSDTGDFSTELASRGYTVLSIDYRLKNNPFINFNRTLTDACEDISDVIHWINDNADRYGMDASHIVIGGDSAGGHLSMNFVNQYLITDPSTVKSIIAIVDIYGGDLTVIPNSELPPVLIIHGTIDTMVPYYKSVKVAEQLNRKGIYYNFLTMEDVGHDYKNEKYYNEVIETTSHFLWNVMNNSDLAKLPENSGMSVASGDAFEIKLPEDYRNRLKEQLNISLPEGWLFISEEADAVQIQVTEDLKRGNHSLFVSSDMEGVLARGFAVNVNVIDPLDVHYETFYDESNKAISTHMKITNRSTNNFSGLVEAAYETEQFTKGNYTSSIEALKPGESIQLDIPELARGERTLKAFNEAGTLLQTKEDSFNVLLLPKFSPSVQLDGNLSEWSDQARFDVKDVKIVGWRSGQDISATGYMSWDSNNLYLAVEVLDDKHAQSASGDAIWSGDSIQIGIGIANSDGTVPSESHEIGVALGDDGALYKWRWMAPMGFDMGDDLELQYAVVRTDSKTNYEIAIPWGELSNDTTGVKQGMKLKFSMLVNDNNGERRRGWLEYNSGIGSAKDINAFGDMYLVE